MGDGSSACRDGRGSARLRGHGVAQWEGGKASPNPQVVWCVLCNDAAAPSDNSGAVAKATVIAAGALQVSSYGARSAEIFLFICSGEFHWRFASLYSLAVPDVNECPRISTDWFARIDFADAVSRKPFRKLWARRIAAQPGRAALRAALIFSRPDPLGWR